MPTKVSQKVTLRTVLIVPFVLQIFTAVGLTGYLSFRNGQQAVNDLAAQLQSEISDRIHQKLDTYLQTPHQINHINLQASKLGLLNLQDFESTGKYFWNQLQVFPVSYINFGNPKGEFIGAGLERKYIRITEKIINRPYEIYAVDNQGNRTALVETRPDGYPNDAAWYKDAVKAGKPIWSAIYNWQDSPDVLAISSSYPVHNQNNQLIGVIGVDLILSKISDFLRQIKIIQTGKTFIIERNGLLVASSTKEPPFVLIKGKAQRIQASASQNPLVRNTAKYLSQKFSNLSEIKQTRKLEFSIAGQNQFVQVTPWRDKFGLDWLIVVVVPEADFMKQINANFRTTILLCFLTLVLATGLGMLTAGWIATPISRLSLAAKGLANKAANANFANEGLEQKIAVIRINELDILAEYFNQMAKQIHSAFTILETNKNQLENRVAERTAEIRATQSELLALFGAMTEIIMVFDAAGRYLKIVPTRPELLYKPAEELIGKTLHEIFPHAKADYFLSHIQDVIFNQKSIKVEYNLQIAEAEVWFAATVSSIDAKSAIFVARDISEQKKAELALKEALLAATAASKAKSAFLSKMSHELRTPLNAIIGFTQVMFRDYSLNKEQQEHVGIIYRSGNYLLQLINDVLSMSKIEAGQITVNETCFDLYQFLNSIQEMLQLKANSKGLELLFETSCDLPQYVQTDESKLRQVLINLLGNAIKFTEKGSVKLRVKGGSGEWGVGSGEEVKPTPYPLLPNATCSTWGNPKTAVATPYSLIFEVEDTGVGIARDEIENLFAPFVQTQTGRQSMEGTGLGLAISQQFVQVMGGNITVKSTLNQGSIFTFDIRVKLANVAVQQPTSKLSRVLGLEPNQPKYRILVVEDVAENHELLVKMLKPLGFEVRAAANGAEGVALWESWQPHLIWMDMLMPIMDGYEATREIKAREYQRWKNAEIGEYGDMESQNITASPRPLVPPSFRTVIIALTANAFEEQREAILAAGCDDFICKPFQEEILLEKMAQHLGVSYIYEVNPQPTSPQLSAQPVKLTTDDLCVMPKEWLLQLDHAARCLDDRLVIELIEQIPETESKLIKGLRDLVNNYRLDIILSLTQAIIL